WQLVEDEPGALTQTLARLLPSRRGCRTFLPPALWTDLGGRRSRTCRVLGPHRLTVTHTFMFQATTLARCAACLSCYSGCSEIMMGTQPSSAASSLFFWRSC